MKTWKQRLASIERNSSSLDNWHLAYDMVLSLILKMEPDWTPLTTLDPAQRSKIARAVNAHWKAHGKALVTQKSWAGMVGASLNRTNAVAVRFQRLTGKAA